MAIGGAVLVDEVGHEVDGEHRRRLHGHNHVGICKSDINQKDMY